MARPLLGGVIGFLLGALLMAVGRGRRRVPPGDGTAWGRGKGWPGYRSPARNTVGRARAQPAAAPHRSFRTAPAGAGVTACRSPSSDTPRWLASALSAGRSPPRGYRYPR